MNHVYSKFSQGALWSFFILAVFQSISLLIWYWPGALPDGNTSGVWTAIAHDFSEGIFYRPLLSERGYGGTRYMPLFFVLHGSLIKLFGDPLMTGVVLSLLSALLLNIGLYGVLLELGLPWKVALPFAGIINGTISFQMTLLNIRCDFLAAALNAWAVFYALRFVKSRSQAFLFITGVLFLGAFLTKMTSLFGLFAVSLYLFFSDLKKYGPRLVLITGLCMAASMVVINHLSDGRSLESFLECSAGGTDPSDASGFFLNFLYELIRDPLLAVLFFPAIVIFVLRYPKDRRRLPALLFGVTLAFTLFIYTSPGTSANHLIDLQAMMVIFLAMVFSARDNYKQWISMVFILNCLLIFLSWLPGTPSIKAFFREHQIPSRKSVELLREHLGTNPAPVFSENPIFPVLMGQRPFVSDAFNLGILIKKHPALREDLHDRIRQQYFSAVIFSNWPGIFRRDIKSPEDPHLKEKREEFNKRLRIEKRLMELLTEHYEIRYVQRPYVFYFPKDLSKIEARAN